jgi:hypothetical protein
VLNRSIQVQREAKNMVPLKAASEGALWKKRHQKRHMVEEKESILSKVNFADIRRYIAVRITTSRLLVQTKA